MYKVCIYTRLSSFFPAFTGISTLFCDSLHSLLLFPAIDGGVGLLNVVGICTPLAGFGPLLWLDASATERLVDGFDKSEDESERVESELRSDESSLLLSIDWFVVYAKFHLDLPEQVSESSELEYANVGWRESVGAADAPPAGESAPTCSTGVSETTTCSTAESPTPSACCCSVPPPPRLSADELAAVALFGSASFGRLFRS